jgi:hypothetical protein
MNNGPISDRQVLIQDQVLALTVWIIIENGISRRVIIGVKNGPDKIRAVLQSMLVPNKKNILIWILQVVQLVPVYFYYGKRLISLMPLANMQ